MHWQVLCIASAFYRTLRKMALSYFDLRIFCFLFSNFVQWSLPLCGSSFNHLFFCNWSNCWTGFQRHDYREEIYRWEKTEDEETNWKSSYFVLWSSPWGSTYYVLPFKYTCLTAPWGRTYYVLRTAIKGFWNMINPLSSPPPCPLLMRLNTVELVPEIKAPLWWHLLVVRFSSNWLACTCWTRRYFRFHIATAFGCNCFIYLKAAWPSSKSLVAQRSSSPPPPHSLLLSWICCQ